MKAILMCLRYAGIKTLILRKTYQELINNHINEMRGLLHGIAKYNSSEKVFRFENGSTIKFGYCANDGDLDQYQGAEYDVVFIDEAGQFQEMWIRKITASVRGANDLPKRIYYTLNPGGPSHGYFKRLFIDKVYNEGEDPEEYRFIQSKVTDNRALMMMQPDYIKQLQALPYKLRRAWLDGDWNVFEGAFFEEWTDDPAHYQDRRWTHVVDPYEIPPGWTIFRSFDWGYSRPFACQWWAVDYDGNLACILELYGMGREPNEGIKWSATQVFGEIAKTEKTHPWLKGKKIHGVADPSIWAKESTGVSIYDSAVAEGVYFSKADNERIPGWMQVHYRLQFDEEGYPRMQFFTNCRHAIRTLPLMMYDPIKVEDLGSDEDHLADSTRYACMSRPIVPAKPREPEPLLLDPLSADMGVKRYGRII